MINLDESLYIAKGAERECYLHPNDFTKVIKVEYNNSIDRNQNNLDLYYYNYLEKKNTSYSNIVKCYGEVETNIGSGVVFDAVKNDDGTFSQSFEDVIAQKTLSKEEESKLLLELQYYLSENNIVFGDVVLSNILCQKISKNNYKLIIIDGLGGRRFGFKLWMHMHSKLFTRLRIQKQFKKLMRNYKQLALTL